MKISFSLSSDFPKGKTCFPKEDNLTGLISGSLKASISIEVDVKEGKHIIEPSNKSYAYKSFIDKANFL